MYIELGTKKQREEYLGGGGGGGKGAGACPYTFFHLFILLETNKPSGPSPLCQAPPL